MTPAAGRRQSGTSTVIPAPYDRHSGAHTTVIPAKAGIHFDFLAKHGKGKMDPGLRRDDEVGEMTKLPR